MDENFSIRDTCKASAFAKQCSKSQAPDLRPHLLRDHVRHKPIHVSRKIVNRRDTRQFDLTQLSKSTDGLTGAEIEQVFIDAMYRAFAEEEEPSDFTIGEVLVDFVPLSKLMAAQISGCKKRRNTTDPYSVNRP